MTENSENFYDKLNNSIKNIFTSKNEIEGYNANKIKDLSSINITNEQINNEIRTKIENETGLDRIMELFRYKYWNTFK